MSNRIRPAVKGSQAETEEFVKGFTGEPTPRPIPSSGALTGQAQDDALSKYSAAKAMFDQRQKAQDALDAQRKAEQMQQAEQQRNAAIPALQRMTGMPTQAPQVQPNRIGSGDLGREHADLIQRYQETMAKQKMPGKREWTDQDDQNIQDYKDLVNNIHPGSNSGQ